MLTAENWHPKNWQKKTALQQPRYQDTTGLSRVLDQIKNSPPLVSVQEVRRLRRQLREVYHQRAFVVQGGDCAESFRSMTPRHLTRKLRALSATSLLLEHHLGRPIIRIGRIAGQYGKPRSKPLEIVRGEALEVFRGENINSYTPDPLSRRPDPDRLLRGYHKAALTLNFLRTMQLVGDSALLNSHWLKESGPEALLSKNYHHLAHAYQKQIHQISQKATKDQLTNFIYTSHEGLILNLEQSLTQRIGTRYYNLGAHTLWIGERTRALSGAHVEYFRGIANPIGIKLGPGTEADELVELCRLLNPSNDPGRLMLVSRMGIDQLTHKLPGLIEASLRQDIKALWLCDPMHGNTHASPSGLKTRSCDSIREEVHKMIEISQQAGVHLAGIHCELTGESVTECTGGELALSPDDIPKAYTSLCDPRLNLVQSLSLATSIGEHYQK